MPQGLQEVIDLVEQDDGATREKTPGHSGAGLRRATIPGKGEVEGEHRSKTDDEGKAAHSSREPDRTLSTNPPAEEDLGGRIRLWLEEERLMDNVDDHKEHAFHYRINYNNKSYRCFQPREAPDKVVLATTTQLSEDHLLALSVLKGNELEEFYWKLRFAFLNRAMFILRMDTKGLLREYTLSKFIFRDGLTKDRLMQDLHQLHDSNLTGIWHIQRQFGPGGETWGAANCGSGGSSGGSGRSDGLRPEMYG